MSVSTGSKPAPQPTLSLATTAFTKRLERRVLAFIRKGAIFRPGEHLFVAVSGGPDSTALLVILSRLRTALDIDLTVAHFDHMMRSREEAVADGMYVEALGAALGASTVYGSADVPARARDSHQSVESAARHMRYDFLAHETGRAGATVIALGHTLDDQAETVLLHLLRGSGLDGLAAMRPRAPWPFGSGPDVARPLLGITRDETERYCRELGLTPRRDPTNDLPISARNRIRNDLLPALREFNPSVEGALVRLGEAAAMDTDFLEAAAEDAWKRLAEPGPMRVSFPRAELARLHPALTARLIRRAVAHLLGSAADVEAVHIREIQESLEKRRYRLSLPDGLIAVVDARALAIARGEPEPVQPIPETTIVVPGRTIIGDWLIETQIVDPPADPRLAGRLEAYLDADAVGDRLTVRSRRPGDRLRPLGLAGEKKVQDILVDAKIPAEERHAVPIVCVPSGIVWVVASCIDERYALRPDSRRALHVVFAKLVTED